MYTTPREILYIYTTPLKIYYYIAILITINHTWYIILIIVYMII